MGVGVFYKFGFLFSGLKWELIEKLDIDESLFAKCLSKISSIAVFCRVIVCKELPTMLDRRLSFLVLIRFIFLVWLRSFVGLISGFDFLFGITRAPFVFLIELFFYFFLGLTSDSSRLVR